MVLSSTCFGERDLATLCSLLVEKGVRGVELSGNLDHLPEPELTNVLRRYSSDLRIYIHNYFPPPRESFVLNLAHPETAACSLAHCRLAIELCGTLGIRQYSIHAGLTFNPTASDLGRSQAHLEPIDMDESRRLLVDACDELASFAETHGVMVLLENNVAAAFNCPNGVNGRYHLAEMEDSHRLLEVFEHPNLGVLLDTGHVKVSAHTFGFDPVAFLERFRPWIRAAHLSENDGSADQNLPVRSDSWFWPHLGRAELDYVSLEVAGQTLEALQLQLALTRERLAYR